MKKTILLSFLLLLSLLSLRAQDTITTIDGQMIEGYVIKEGSRFIHLADSEEDTITSLKLSKKKIDHINYQNGKERSFGNSEDIRILRPYGISAGFEMTRKNDYGNLYGKIDYFMTPHINYEIHAGVSWVAMGVNYYFHKPDKRRSLFPYVGLMGGYDYNGYGSPLALMPVGISKMFSSGLNIRLGVSGAVFFDHLENSDRLENHVFGQVMVGYRLR